MVAIDNKMRTSCCDYWLRIHFSNNSSLIFVTKKKKKNRREKKRKEERKEKNIQKNMISSSAENRT